MKRMVNTKLADKGDRSKGDNQTTAEIDSSPMPEQEKPDSQRMGYVTKLTIVVHINVFFYSTCFWIQTGVLPYLTKKLGVDAEMFGYLQTTFALVQLCGGPLYGRFGDLFGGKAALILAFIGSALAYGLLAVSTSIPLLFISRLPSIVMHSVQGSQMVIADITPPSERASALGKIGISYGLGMIVGPFLGGVITEIFDEPSAALTAAFGSLLSVFIVLAFLPMNTKLIHPGPSQGEDEKEGAKSRTRSVFDFSEIFALLKIKNVTYILIIKTISGLPLGIFQSMFSIVAMNFFQLGPKENGIVLSYVGILGMLVQGFGIGPLTKRFREFTLLRWSVAVTVVAYLFLIIVTNIYQFCVVMIPLVAGGFVLSVVITSIITKLVPYEETGAALGLSMASHALNRFVSPTIGGVLFKHLGFPAFGVIGFGLNSALAGYLFFLGREVN